LPRGGSREHDPHLAAVAGIVHPDDLWQLCRDELVSTSAPTAGTSDVSGEPYIDLEREAVAMLARE
jgi:hypothetical protein